MQIFNIYVDDYTVIKLSEIEPVIMTYTVETQCGSKLKDPCLWFDTNQRLTSMSRALAEVNKRFVSMNTRKK